MDKLSEIIPENLAGVYKEVAEAIGVYNAYEIFCNFKGQQFMFPLKFYSSEYSNLRTNSRTLLPLYSSIICCAIYSLE